MSTLVHDCEHGHIMLTNGPFLEVQAKADDGGATAIVGDDLTAPGGKLKLQIRVQCPNWLEVNRVQIFVNGKPEAKLNFTRRTHPDKFHQATVVFAESVPINSAPTPIWWSPVPVKARHWAACPAPTMPTNCLRCRAKIMPRTCQPRSATRSSWTLTATASNLTATCSACRYRSSRASNRRSPTSTNGRFEQLDRLRNQTYLAELSAPQYAAASNANRGEHHARHRGQRTVLGSGTSCQSKPTV